MGFWPTRNAAEKWLCICDRIRLLPRWRGCRSVNTTMIYAHLAPQDDEINVL